MECNRIQNNSSSFHMTWKYDVFLSFRGEDTRNNFTDHLFGALHRKSIITFKDDVMLKKGECVSYELLQAIEGSQILIVVFSKNYASSTWCLQELAKIADCIEVPGQSVLPLFYDVNPTEVRKQTGNFEKAFVEHEERFKGNLEMVKRWREALAQVGNLSGWDIRDKPQYLEIEKIIKEVARLLGHKVLSLPRDIVGIHSRIEELEKLLILDSNDDVRVVGICGMGGIGKTTLATTLYERISDQFDACCFIDDVSKIFGDYGPIGAQNQLLYQILNEENLQIYNLSKGTNLIRARLSHIKALIILDNVDQVEQLEKLAMNREWLGAGTRIIIISRNEHILREHEVDEIYRVQLLNYDNALQLFCRKAFKCDDIKRDYKILIEDVLTYANGLPLALKVLGSFLFGRDAIEWKSALVRLRENPRKDIMDVLRISFDAMEDTEKEIFLDIACFFHKNSKTYVRKVLDYHGFHPDIGIRVLIEKSLVTCEKGTIHMHDLLKELGRSIVREKSPKEPRKWTRLWSYKDLLNVMLENMPAENLEAIVMQQYPIKNGEITMKVDALSKMNHLKLLILWNVNFAPRTLNYLSKDLRYLSWDRYPFTSLPTSFQPDELVELRLPHSNIRQLWEGTKSLHNLTHMDLSYAKNLIKIPHFWEVPNLKWLKLEGCTQLVLIDPSIAILGKLSYLNLKNCRNLVNFPNIFGLRYLKRLNLSGCPKLLNKQLLEKLWHAKHLEKPDINESTTQNESTFSIYKILMLPFRFFSSQKHEDSVGLLLSSLSCFPYLQHLDISFCNLIQIPEAIGWLHFLEGINLGGNNFVALPPSIKELSKLRLLNLEHCKQLKYLPELPSLIVVPIRNEGSFGKYSGGLYIFDCPNLSKMECCYSMAFSWMIQLLKVHVQSSFSFGQIDIIVPGTQIPRWFNKQNMGSSINMDLSPIMRDKNWIGVACCASFAAHYDPTNLSDRRSYLDYANVGFGFQDKQCGCGSFHMIPIHLEKDLVTVELDHLLLLFCTREQFIDEHLSFITKGMHDLDGIKLATRIQQPHGLHLEVKNCGYRWVFKEDLEQLTTKIMHNENLPIPGLKFLTND